MPPDTTDTPDLLASTGINDPNSIWGLDGLLQTGVNIGNEALQQALRNQTPLTAASYGNGVPASAPAAQAPAPSVAGKWALWVMWGAVIALVLWVVVGERR